jgi:hypothetical protein
MATMASVTKNETRRRGDAVCTAGSIQI